MRILHRICQCPKNGVCGPAGFHKGAPFPPVSWTAVGGGLQHRHPRSQDGLRPLTRELRSRPRPARRLRLPPSRSNCPRSSRAFNVTPEPPHVPPNRPPTALEHNFPSPPRARNPPRPPSVPDPPPPRLPTGSIEGPGAERVGRLPHGLGGEAPLPASGRGAGPEPRPKRKSRAEPGLLPATRRHHPASKPELAGGKAVTAAAEATAALLRLPSAGPDRQEASHQPTMPAGKAAPPAGAAQVRLRRALGRGEGLVAASARLCVTFHAGSARPASFSSGGGTWAPLGGGSQRRRRLG